MMSSSPVAAYAAKPKDPAPHAVKVKAAKAVKLAKVKHPKAAPTLAVPAPPPPPASVAPLAPPSLALPQVALAGLVEASAPPALQALENVTIMLPLPFGAPMVMTPAIGHITIPPMVWPWLAATQALVLMMLSGALLRRVIRGARDRP